MDSTYNQSHEEAKGPDITEDAILYLEKKTYRIDCPQNRKRAIRKKCQKLRLVNGEILYERKCGQVRNIIICNSTFIL